jgi:hypothetical protein
MGGDSQNGKTADSADEDYRQDSSLFPRGAVFQISMRAILLTMAALAIMVAAVFAFPPILSAVMAVIMSACIPAVLVASIVYGSPKWRAFALGMLVPSVLRLFGHSPLGTDLLRALVWQPNPQQSGISPTNSTGYFAQLGEVWSLTGHALMAEEFLFWTICAVGGFFAAAVQRHFDRTSSKQ